MNQLFDKKYPVTSSYFPLTTGAFSIHVIASCFWLRISSNCLRLWGVLGYEIQVTQAQSWRFVAAIFVHVGLQHFCFEHGYLYFIGRIAEDLFGLKAFLASLPLIRLNGQSLSWFFLSLAVAAGAFTALSGIFGAIASLRFIASVPIFAIWANVILDSWPKILSHAGDQSSRPLEAWRGRRGFSSLVFPVYGERDNLKKLALGSPGPLYSWRSFLCFNFLIVLYWFHTFDKLSENWVKSLSLFVYISKNDRKLRHITNKWIKCKESAWKNIDSKGVIVVYKTYLCPKTVWDIK